jgi:hypothetical protein
MRTCYEFQLLDHGIDHAQYFPGCGVAFTEYKQCFTGCGSNCAEAINDALEQIAMSTDYDVTELEKRMLYENGLTEWPTVPNTDKAHEENEESELYYYVSIRVK